MAQAHSWRRGGALVVAHVAGMIDLVALPLWVSALMTGSGFDARRAGLLVTLYLVGVVASCVLLAPRIGSRGHRAVIAASFIVAALAFGTLARPLPFGAMAALHGTAGLAAGIALSLTHRRIGLVPNAHRLFAVAGLALGVFSVLFLANVPALIAAHGTRVLFVTFAGVTLVAALAALAGLGRDPAAGPVQSNVWTRRVAPLAPPVRWLIAGVVCMTITQATVFSFLDRIGAARGFSPAQLQGVLIALGLVNLVPAPLAALLERRLDAGRVALAGPVLQGLLALVVCDCADFAPFAVAAAVYVSVMIFCHTFVFGLLARLDTTGRATSLTPAMLMSGSAVGPVLGGSIAVQFGLPALGPAALVVCAVGVFCFMRARRSRVVPAAALAH
jgi:predicted MFS family arabinose efflux permease